MVLIALSVRYMYDNYFRQALCIIIFLFSLSLTAHIMLLYAF